MKKVSKILAMALVVLAVITMSLNAHAAEGHNILNEYITTPHVINSMLFELKNNAQKTAITNYVSTLSIETVSAIHADLVSMENTIRNTGATNTSQISTAVKTQILNQAKATAAKAGLTLTVNTSNKTFTLKKADGTVLASGCYLDLVVNPGAAPAPSAGGSAAPAPAANTGRKLLYTGSNYVVYALPVFAIIAVALVAKKRA